MLQEFKSKNLNDADGNPAGGTVEAIGLKIDWQNGPLSIDGERQEPSGAFVETVIAAALQRIKYYQASKFECRENAIAVLKLEEALLWLNKRTCDREARGVEGTHVV